MLKYTIRKIFHILQQRKKFGKKINHHVADDARALISQGACQSGFEIDGRVSSRRYFLV